MTLEIECSDGSIYRRLGVSSRAEAWEHINEVEKYDEVKSVWLDDEPWIGLCTDMREGQP